MEPLQGHRQTALQCLLKGLLEFLLLNVVEKRIFEKSCPC